MSKEIMLSTDDMIYILEHNGYIIYKNASFSDDIDDEMIPNLDGEEMLKYLRRLLKMRDWSTKNDIINKINEL